MCAARVEHDIVIVNQSAIIVSYVEKALQMSRVINCSPKPQVGHITIVLQV